MTRFCVRVLLAKRCAVLAGSRCRRPPPARGFFQGLFGSGQPAAPPAAPLPLVPPGELPFPVDMLSDTPLSSARPPPTDPQPRARVRAAPDGAAAQTDGKLALAYRASQDGWSALEFHRRCGARRPPSACCPLSRQARPTHDGAQVRLQGPLRGARPDGGRRRVWRLQPVRLHVHGRLRVQLDRLSVLLPGRRADAHRAAQGAPQPGRGPRPRRPAPSIRRFAALEAHKLPWAPPVLSQP